MCVAMGNASATNSSRACGTRCEAPCASAIDCGGRCSLCDAGSCKEPPRWSAADVVGIAIGSGVGFALVAFLLLCAPFWIKSMIVDDDDVDLAAVYACAFAGVVALVVLVVACIAVGLSLGLTSLYCCS
jgi:hypothetical protein